MNDSIMTEIASKLTFQVNNDIDDFIVREVSNYSLLQHDNITTINTKKIYEALKKEIPLKPIVKELSSGIITSCGACYTCLGMRKMFEYCPRCGQKIDWNVSGWESNPD